MQIIPLATPSMARGRLIYICCRTRVASHRHKDQTASTLCLPREFAVGESPSAHSSSPGGEQGEALNTPPILSQSYALNNTQSIIRTQSYALNHTHSISTVVEISPQINPPPPTRASAKATAASVENKRVTGHPEQHMHRGGAAVQVLTLCSLAITLTH